MVRPIVPRIPGIRGLSHAPQMKRPRRKRAAAPAPWPGVAQLPKEEFDIGLGPWYYKGQKASSAEYRCLMILEELGWSPSFQVRKFGGRRIAGGQVLDILVEERNPPVYIDVRGYYHRGAQGEADDARSIFQLRAAAPEVKILVVWDDEARNRELLYQRLLREVGARGGSNRV